MRTILLTRAFLAGLFFLTFSVPLAGAQTRPATVGRPVAAGRLNRIPDVNFNGNSLEEVVDFLRDVDPTFQAVVARDADAGNGPNIQLKLKNVTAEQVLKVLVRLYPNVEADNVDSGIVVLRIHPPMKQERNSPGQFVNIYNLSGTVNALKAANGSTTEKAMADVLSLIQAAVAQAPQEPTPVIQVHEATQ